MATDLDKAWAAGFFDGEGNVSYLRPDSKRRTPRILIQVAQVDITPLNKLSAALGGGKVNGPYEPRTKKSSPYYRWALEGYEVVHQAFLDMGPWLSLKTEAFTDALDRYSDWRLDPRCRFHPHEVMSVSKIGRRYCFTCTSESNRDKMIKRWELAHG